ncbi:DUF2510 domain-containing protein [Microbacterium sp.]|uniref:DUF2510 domain-containing protein n=1 Tax=Microbacterium sp. TaxID=51671 RepID=UPI0028115D0A|nr:DUF2510 domain-containing protein [Microbacterium sp.]
MTTPAGWYDDGSGRQRWWDGQQWTEHFAPEAEAPAATDAPAAEPAAGSAAPQDWSNGDSLDDTVMRPSGDAPAASSDADAQPTEAFSAPGETASYPSSAPYPGSTPAVPEYAAPSYPDAAAAYAPPAPGYPAADSGGAYPGAATGVGTPEEPKKLSVIGLVGLGLAALGTILGCIPPVMVVGWVLLGLGFIVSIVSLFLKGKKWPGIVGLSVAVVGTIISIIVAAVFFTLSFADAFQDELDNFPTSIPSDSASPEPDETDASDDTATGTGRPTVEEVAAGLTEVITALGENESYSPEQITCIAEGFVSSDIPDDTLRVIANGEEMYTDPDALTAFSEKFTEWGVTCLMP